MWDTWVFYYNGAYYLYYLVATEWDPWNGFSVATSTDGVHWKETGSFFLKSAAAVWQGTGSVWKSPSFHEDRKFQCNFSEEFRGAPQHIYFAESTDLIHWTRLDKSHEFRQDTRWYEEKGRWDCIYTIPRPGGGLFGYWTATPKGFVGFGFGETLDGVHWTSLPPPAMDWGSNRVPSSCELGAVEKIGEKYYAMVGAGSMLTFVASDPRGPFRAASKNFHLLTGNCYFSRFFPSPDGMLVTHQSITHERRKSKSVSYAAPLKRAVVDAEGTLRLHYWEGNEKLKGRALTMTAPSSPRNGSIALLAPVFDVGRGVVVEGEVTLPPPGSSLQPGFYVEAEDDLGAAVRIAPGGITEVGPIRRDGTGFLSQFRDDREIPFGRTAPFRLLLRHCLLEFYLDDVLFSVYSLPLWATGRIGLLEAGAGIGDLKAWTMSLPEVPRPSRDRGLAWRKPAKASSGSAGLAFDGNPATLWESTQETGRRNGWRWI